MIPLAIGSRDAQILGFVRQIEAIGRHRRAWGRADIARVVMRHLAGDAHKRAIAAAHARAERAEAETQRLRERVAELEHALLRHTATPIETRPIETTPAHHHRSVVLSELQAEIVARACRGATPLDIARVMGSTRTAVQNHLSRAAARMDADSPSHAVALVNRKVVEVRVKSRRAA